MRRITGTFSTTHWDSHGDRISPNALRSMQEKMTSSYIIVGNEHDIRYPPIGRVVSAEVVKLEDGEYALEGESEIWEESDTPETLRGDGRVIPLKVAPPGRFATLYDGSFLHQDGKALVQDLVELSGNEDSAEFELKKAVDPISTLVIMVPIVILGTIGHGFWTRLGGDLYDMLKNRLKYFYGESADEDRMLDLSLGIEIADRGVEVHVVVTNPTEGELELFFDQRLEGLDELVERALQFEPDISRIVVEWKDGVAKLRYAVRDDAVPIVF